MSRKRKTIVITAILCMLAALSGCGSNSISAGSSGKAGNSREAESIVSAADTSKKKEYTKGTLTDTSFESEFIGIRYDAPENCIMATEEDMDSMIDFGGELFYADADKKVLDYAKASTVYEMMCSEPTGRANALVMVEKLPLTNIKVDQYMDSLKQQLDKTNILYTYGDKTSETIAGQEYAVLPTTAVTSGMTLRQDYALRKVGNRMIVICITFGDGDTEARDEIMSGFKPL